MAMVNDPNERVDERLRTTFEVDDGVATRLADRSLVGPRRPRARRWPKLAGWRLRASLALATVAFCAGLAAWLSRPIIVPVPTTPPGADVSRLFGSFVDGVLIVPIPDDVIVVAQPERRENRPRDGSGIVVVEGDAR
jgi:hypothetical protein